MNQSSRSNPLHSPDASALFKDKNALMKLLGSSEARQLISMLASQDGAKLKAAAEQAKKGDATALTSMVNNLREQPEGAKLMQQIEQNFPGKKK